MSDSRRRVNYDETPKMPYRKPKSNPLKSLKGYNLDLIEDLYTEDDEEYEEY